MTPEEREGEGLPGCTAFHDFLLHSARGNVDFTVQYSAVALQPVHVLMAQAHFLVS